MKPVPPEPEVDLYKDGFEDGAQDVLARRPLGQSLSRLLNKVEDPLVVALNGQWGTGKTYFLKRWVGHHGQDHKDATVVYLDAFASDYRSTPLEALVAALTARISGIDRGRKIKALKKAAFVLALSALNRAVPGTTESARIVPKAWRVVDEKTAALQNFRQTLESLTAPSCCTGPCPPLVIVIDELDRCRPDYALEMLEVIKHLFAVPRLHFVLGVNLTALEAMVRARYGTEIDARTYLGKFIQVTLTLPDEVGDGDQSQKAILPYLDHLVRTKGIKDYIAVPLRKQIKVVARNNPVSLRDIGTIVSAVALAGTEVTENPENKKFFPGWINVMNTLIIAKVLRPALYPKFLAATITDNEIMSYLRATAQTVKESTDDDRNPDYDDDTSLYYHTWLWLSANGTPQKVYPDAFDGHRCAFILQHFYERGIGGQFPREIPMRAHRQWLDVFRIYQQDGS